MSSIGTSKGILEVGKFALYVSLPILLMYNLANNSENMKKLIQKDLPMHLCWKGSSGCQRIDGKYQEDKGARREEVRQGSSNHKDFAFERPYIVHPPEGPRPPSPEELREMARELARKKNIR